MRAEVVLADQRGAERRVAVEWAGSATLGQLLEAAEWDPGKAVTAVWVDGFARGLETPCRDAGLRDGTVISTVSRPGGDPPGGDVGAADHVAVTSGPFAGTMIPLHPWPSYIGRDPSCEVTLDDPGLAGRQAVLEYDQDRTVWLTDLAGTTTVDGQEVVGPVAVRPGQTIRFGMSTAEVRTGRHPDAVTDDAWNCRHLRRPPRIRPPVEAAQVPWPDPPDPPGRQPIPWAAALAPVAMGIVLYAVTGQVLTLLFIGLSPIMALSNVVSSRRSGASHHRRAVRAYEAARSEASSALASALDTERRDRLGCAPDPATIAATAAGPTRSLWERRRHDEDFLNLRLGLATLTAHTCRVPSSLRASSEALGPLRIEDVPAVVDLQQIGVLGVAGPPAVVAPLACWLVGQAAVMSGPADLQMVVLSGPSSDHERRWGWARWLPHTRPTQDGDAPLFGTTRETIEARLNELVELIRARSGEGPVGSGPRSTDWPHVLVVMDPAYDVRRLAGADVVLRHGPSVGIHAICVETADSHLPLECRATVTVDGDGGSILSSTGQSRLRGIRTDLVSAGWCDLVGRSLAPLRDPEAVSPTGAIPGAVRLVDLLGLDRLDWSAVLAGWARSRRSTRAVLGVGANGPFELDLRTDGPHGLVGGTTGSGKSELLQTLIASLAVANRHDGLNFLLVDYKGGAAFRECANLPHTVGVVTDLDHHLTARALESLSAELRRREAVLLRGGAKDIDDYLQLGEPAGPLPRLLIVIDEFAGLAAELPDFVSGLVAIAQRGRSLGIHMILATQRPSGVVSPEIRANTNLRVALRVTSAAESADIIDGPEAATISPATPGRAYARTGHSALTPFQSARVGGPAQPAETDGKPEVAVAERSWDVAGSAAVLAMRDEGGRVDPSDSDLARLARLLTEAAERSGVERSPKPWLEPLPDLVDIELLAKSLTGAPAGAAPYGLIDLPSEQRQAVAAYDPARARHLAVAGGPGSGRTTFLRTLAMSLASVWNPDDLWLYGIDCGSGDLRRLVHLPHTGAVVTRSEPERADRLLNRLHAEMGHRLEKLSVDGFADVTEQRAAAPTEERLPFIVVLLDRWEGFIGAFDTIDNQRLTDTVLDVVREGGAAGIRLVVTGDRTVLSGRLAASIDDQLFLSLPDRNDYVFAGLDPRRVPPSMAPGRALRGADGAELQIAVAGADPSGAAQAAAVGHLARAWREHTAEQLPNRPPLRIDSLPTEIDEVDAGLYPDTERTSPHSALVAVGGDELHRIRVDVSRTGGFVVAGPRHSGRSNALMVMARSLLANRCAVIAFCPRPSPLTMLAGFSGVAGVFTGDDPPLDQVLDTVNQVEGPLAVLVDDALALQNSAVAELLSRIALEGAPQGHALVVSGVAEELMRPARGFIYQAALSRSGLLLCPENATDGSLLGRSLPRSAVFHHPPGRGILVTGAALRTVQVPRAGEFSPVSG